MAAAACAVGMVDDGAEAGVVAPRRGICMPARRHGPHVSPGEQGPQLPRGTSVAAARYTHPLPGGLGGRDERHDGLVVIRAVVKRDVPVDGDGQERLARRVTFARQNRFCGRRSVAIQQALAAHRT